VKACLPKARVRLLETPGEIGAARMAGGVDAVPARPVPEKPVNLEALPTERANPRSRGLHKQSVGQLVRLFVSEEKETARALQKAAGSIGKAAGLVAAALRQKGRLVYVGAGTSGRLGVLDASEMPPTFHADPEEVQAILAGGPEAIFRAQEGAEDDSEAGQRAVQERKVGKGDVVVGLTASGRTPFVHGALREATRRGAKTVLVTAHPAWRPEKGGIRPSVVVCLDVGPAMIRMGRVHDNLMVNVVPSNEKLRARALRLVRLLTGANADRAARALRQGEGKVMAAVLKIKNRKG